MSDPPVPWSGRATRHGTGPPRSSQRLCERVRGATARAGERKGTLRTLLASTQASGLGREGAACPSPLASQWGGWALQRAPLPAPHAGLSPSIRTAGSRSRCPPSSRPPDAPAAPTAFRAPRPSPLLSHKLTAQDVVQRGVPCSVGVRREGDRVALRSQCAQRGKPLTRAPLARLGPGKTGRTSLS